MNELKLTVGGMTCGGCVRSVTAVLKALPGVEDAQVSLEAAEARVRFDPERVTVATMLAAVENAGFDASA